MSAGSYLGGSLAVAAVVTALGWGAFRLRAALLADWSGPPARLAEIVMMVTVPVGLAQLSGSFGMLTRGPMLLGCITAGIAMGMVGSRLTPRTSAPVVAATDAPPPRRERTEEIVAAGAAGAVVAGQWVSYTAAAWSRGMTDGDTLWYHAPFAGRFVQTGRLTGLSDTGLSDLATPLHSFLPLNSSVFHAIAMLPFGNDFLSPAINLAGAALALLAAWCIGRRRGVGALCVLGAVLVLGLPTLVATQPGSASNDLATGALFLVAVALLLEGDLTPVPTGLAALAAGIALGTKLTVATPIAVLTLGILWLTWRARRPAAAIVWCIGLFLSGGYWFVRNWVVLDNPMPYFEVNLGPLAFEASFERHPTILDHVTDRDVWSAFYLPGLSEAFGRGWPVLLALGFGGAGLAVLRGRRPLERFAGAAVFAGAAGYVAIPGTGDLGGGLFVLTLRYLAPVLLVGFALLALELERAGTAWRRAAWVAMVALVVLHATTGRYDDLPAWADGQVVTGVVAAIVVAAVAVVAVLVWPRVPRVGARTLAAAGVVLVVAVGGAGWMLSERFLDQRYVDAGLPLDGANAVFRDVRDSNVAVFGTERLYPMFGLDLSNRASKVDVPEDTPDTELCAAWRQALHDGGFGYVVLGQEPLTERGPAEEWLQSDAAVTQRYRGADAVVFQIEGELDPAGCE